jgi:hypothetical protein
LLVTWCASVRSDVIDAVIEGRLTVRETAELFRSLERIKARPGLAIEPTFTTGGGDASVRKVLDHCRAALEGRPDEAEVMRRLRAALGPETPLDAP